MPTRPHLMTFEKLKGDISMISKFLKNEIKDAFQGSGLTLSFGEGFINIARGDGMHCEFCTCAEEEESLYLTATYKVDGKEKTFDFCIPDEVEEFKTVVQKILKD